MRDPCSFSCCPVPSAARELAYPGVAHETTDRLARLANTPRSAGIRELGRSRFGRFDGLEVLQSSRRRWVDRFEQQKPLLRVTTVHVTIRFVRWHDRTALTLHHDLGFRGTLRSRTLVPQLRDALCIPSFSSK